MELFTFFQSKESYNEDEILEMKEILNNQKVIVIKGVWDKNFIKSIKDHLASVGNSSIPNYHPILPDSKNFHRINKTDERSFVKASICSSLTEILASLLICLILSLSIDICDYW